MTRQNQALQVATIIFATLAVTLGVSTFVCFRHWQETADKAEANLKEADRMQAAGAARQQEIEELKRLIGFALTARLEAVQEQFGEDMQTCAAGLPEETRFYHPLVRFLDRLLRSQTVEMGRQVAEVRRWKDRFAAGEEATAAQIARFQEASRRAGEEALAIGRTARQDWKRICEEKEQLHRQMVGIREETDRVVAGFQAKLTTLHQDYEKTRRQLKTAENKLKRLRREDFDTPDGKIHNVNYRLRTAWIDLGWADELRPQVEFFVYPANAAWVEQPARKGKIKVTRVLDDHLAEARVIESELLDPILRGDHIHTPLWSRSE